MRCTTDDRKKLFALRFQFYMGKYWHSIKTLLHHNNMVSLAFVAISWVCKHLMHYRSSYDQVMGYICLFQAL